MNRRDFLRSASAVSAGLVCFGKARLSAQAMTPESWRTFEVMTRVEVLKYSGTTRIWVPAALSNHTPFQRTLSNTFNADGGTAKIFESKANSVGIIAAEFPAGAKPILTVTSQVKTKNYAVDLSRLAKHRKQAARNWIIFCARPDSSQRTESSERHPSRSRRTERRTSPKRARFTSGS